ncbi:MAG: aminoglycoside phosphotransferase family protein [Actinomycetota bacterium]
MSDHPGLSWFRESEAGSAWLDRLPRPVEECAERWALDLGEPFAYAFASLALPAVRQDGSEAVLKIQFPDHESELEAAALARWEGDGAVRLYEYDADRRALLIERCRPGTPLKEFRADDALDVLVDLLPRLWRSASSPFRALGDEAAWWADSLPEDFERAGRPFEQELFDEALDAMRTLSATQGEQVLVNQDLHADNVLLSRREPWLVIDPKPLVGEREFGIAAIVRGGELGHSREAVLHRLDHLTDELHLDRDRARRWALAHTIAWALDNGEVEPEHVEVARWLWEAH